MSELLSAGVFTEELQSGQTAILSVSTSNFATVAWFPRGIENKAINTTSLPDFFRKFGTYWKNSDGPLGVTAFYNNGGRNGYFVRVCPPDAVAAQGAIPNRWNLAAISRGTWGNLVRLVLKGNDNSYDHDTAMYSLFDVEIHEESVDGLGDYQVVETFEGVDLLDPDSADYFPVVLNDNENGSKEVRISMGVSGGVPDEFLPASVTAEAVGSGDGTQTVFNHTAAETPLAPFTLQILVDGVAVAEDNGRGRLTALASSFTSVTGTVNYASGAVATTFAPAPTSGAVITTNYLRAGATSMAFDLSGGVEGTAVSRSEVTDPVLAATASGIYALDEIEDILNIGLLDFRGDATVAGDVLSYCENRQDCFAILDTKPNIDAQDAKNYKQRTLSSLSSWGAMYWPGIKIADPLRKGRPRAISPVGHIAGAFARTDNNKNVGKAPAGTVDGALNFSIGLERITTLGDRNLVYPANVNPLIDTTATGRAIWGARTLQVSGDFNLVNVRRLFIFLRKSTFNSTQDLVFENIDDQLFSIVSLRMSGFLNRLTGEKYFASQVPDKAYKVVCDSSNNTPETIAARQLITDVYVAPATPAEFVRFRFQRQLNALS